MCVPEQTMSVDNHIGDHWYGKLNRGAPLAVLLAAGLLIAYELLPILKLIAVSMLITLVFRTSV